MLAPPWIPVPPRGYGGIEEVVAHLTGGLVRCGHDVTLFAAPGSSSPGATTRPVLEEAHPDRIGSALLEADHVARVFAELDASAAAGQPFDVVHDHSGFVALSMADRLTTPLIHTVHGPFDAETARFYGHHGSKAQLVCLSEAQARTAPPGVAITSIVANPIAVSEWPYQAEKEPFLLWTGRMSPVKGPHRAIEAARRSGLPLVLAGPIQPGQEEFFNDSIAPEIDGRSVRYLGEVRGARKRALFSRATALLMPIRWVEPFGMVMVEAMACGTPVIAFPEGAATEIVVNGVNGFLVDDEREMAAAVGALDTVDAADCRASVESRYDVAVVTASYERLYRDCAQAGQPETAAFSGTSTSVRTALPRREVQSA